MGGACSKHGKDDIIYTIICLENLKGRAHLRDIGIDISVSTLMCGLSSSGS